MSADDWQAVASAYTLVKTGAVKRVDGATWSVYAVGSNLIRVDVKV